MARLNHSEQLTGRDMGHIPRAWRPRVHPDAPPFLVVHGGADTVIPVQQAHDFVTTLRGVSRSPVGYIELPAAGHAFDMTDGARTPTMARAIGLFLNEVRRNQSLAGAKQVI